VIPLAIVIAVIGVVELLDRTAGDASVPPRLTAATVSPVEPRPVDVRRRVRQESERAVLPPPDKGRSEAKPGRDRLSRLKRGDERTLEVILGELAAGYNRSRGVMADAISEIETRVAMDLEEQSRIQTSTQTAIEILQETFTSSASDVTIALGSVSEMCELVTDRIEAHRLERPALAEAIARLARPVPVPVPVPVGVPRGAPAIIADDIEISIVEDDIAVEPEGGEHVAVDDVAVNELAIDEAAIDEAAPLPVPQPAPSVAPAPTRLPEPSWQYRSRPESPVLTSVKRLRQRAQTGWEAWKGSRPRPDSNGHSSSS
jgi:hypothetical protein